MATIVDRRSQPNNQAANRKRFLDRYKPQAKKAVERALSGGNITDIGKDGVDVTIPKRDLNEPKIHHGQGGIVDRVLPGNKEFTAGQRIKRPNGGGGGGGSGDGASEDGSGEDDFVFHLSEEEFLNYLFEDLELPNLIKRNEQDAVQTKPKYAGIISDGPPNKLHLARSKRSKMSRMAAANGRYNQDIVALLQEERDLLDSWNMSNKPARPPSGLPFAWQARKHQIAALKSQVSYLKSAFLSAVTPQQAMRIDNIEEEIRQLEKRKGRIPQWNESTDLKFRLHTQQPVPTSKAVMFCVMDVSASMDQETKNNAKIFYFLLHRFLKKHYEKVDIVFIRHHSAAEEVDEKKFFYDPSTGGTVVSTGLQLMLDIMRERYGDDWNIYGAQASDGDNSYSDNNKTAALMHEILKQIQGYFYIEITQRDHQNLWETYAGIMKEYSDRFWMSQVQGRKDITPIFRDFFKKRGNEQRMQAFVTPAP